MACSACNKRKEFKDVKVTTTYTPKVGQPTKFTDVIMSFSVEKKPNVSGENKQDNTGS